MIARTICLLLLLPLMPPLMVLLHEPKAWLLDLVGTRELAALSLLCVEYMAISAVLAVMCFIRDVPVRCILGHHDHEVLKYLRGPKLKEIEGLVLLHAFKKCQKCGHEAIEPCMVPLESLK